MGLRKEFGGFDRRVWTLFTARTIDGAGFSFMYPFLAIYLHDQQHISMSMVGLILLVAAGAGAIGNLVGGEIADAYGRKRIMTVSIIERGAGSVAVSARPALPNTRPTSGTVRMRRSWIWRIFWASVSLRPGRVDGM